ncbi:MAG: YggS family pyridoxal phosphate-dependent enzyme [Thermodesulfovibrionales bacterium]
MKNVYTRMARAALKSERDLTGIRLLAVTKGVGPETISAAVESGLREFGESRVQAAREKAAILRETVRDSVLVWHLIGHLQKNKVRPAVELFDLIHSVDSPELAELLDTHAGQLGKIQNILLQVKLSDEESKHGFSPEGVLKAAERVCALKNLKVTGLMTIPPYFEEPAQVRPFYRELRLLRDTLISRGFELRELSMGMSHDFEVAIEEGATIVRVGTELFGERKKEAA